MTRWQIESSYGRIAIAGELRTADAAAIWRSLRHHVHRVGQGGSIEIDLAHAVELAANSAAIDAVIVAIGSALTAASDQLADRVVSAICDHGTGDSPP